MKEKKEYVTLEEILGDPHNVEELRRELHRPRYDPEHLNKLKRGVKFWNAWRLQHPEIQPDLRDADLQGFDLSDFDLYSANLYGANLSQATLKRVKLSHAELGGLGAIEGVIKRTDLSHADLNDAQLGWTNLSFVDLHGANLSSADLSYATLHYTDLNAVNLSKANVSATIFDNVDLRTTKGLAEIKHGNASIVQLHTVQLPQDGSSLHFLRGAGIPDEWIDFYRAQMMSPVQYHSCFISYSSNDDILAHRLYSDLQNHGVRCWFAQEDMKFGDKIRDRIDEAIHLHEKLLLLLSEHSIASSWVEDEVEAALEKEKQQRRDVLFPIRLDEQVMHTSTAWAAKLRRTRHIGDFTNWTNPQAYQWAFNRLLRDLKAGNNGEEETDGKLGAP